mgnify:FL=1
MEDIFELELRIKFESDIIFNREKGCISITNNMITGQVGNDTIYGVYGKNIKYPLLYSDFAMSFYKGKYLFVYPSLSSSKSGTIYENDKVVGNFKFEYLKKCNYIDNLKR